MVSLSDDAPPRPCRGAAALVRRFDQQRKATRRMPRAASAQRPGRGSPTPPAPREHGYSSEPEAIYARSFAIIDAETDWTGVPDVLRPVVRRMIHACGMTDITRDLAWSDDVVAAATGALAAGAPVATDARMVAHGIIGAALPAGNDVRCVLDLVATAPAGTTRSAAGIDAAADALDGAVVAIGNAPTALFRLLELARAGAAAPAAVIGLPVGFVGAVESKRALAADAPFPFLTLHGRRGGSAMAAAAVNALAMTAARP
jgi:precorrin-8X/cobalt-precorrin-8 methylmutase